MIFTLCFNVEDMWVLYCERYTMIYIYLDTQKPYKNVGYEKTQGFSTKPDVFKFAVLMVKREMNRIILFQHIPAFLAATPNKHVVGKLLVLLSSLLTTG
jgi:hypothetical protein